MYTPIYIWIIFAITLLILELTNPSLFFFMALAVGSLAAAVTNALGQQDLMQCFIFILGSLMASLTLQCLVKYLRKHKTSRVYESNTDLLLGKQIEIISLTSPHAGHGKVGGEIWAITINNEQPASIGMTGIITGVRGCHLEIEIYNQK